MAAIDLLLNWSPESERMHQVVLTGLLQHTSLLDKLGIKGKPKELEIETQNKLYDFSIEFDNQEKVHIELKVNSELSKNQVERQLNALKKGEKLLYILIGITRFKWNKKMIDEICIKNKKNEFLEDIRVFKLEDIRLALDSLAAHSSDHDHRDLAVAYITLLHKIEELTEKFQELDTEKWKWYDWIGYFVKLNEEISKEKPSWNYVANPSGGFLAFTWNWEELPKHKDILSFLQLEENKLCWKIYSENKDKGVEIRNKLSDLIIQTAVENDLKAKKPNKFGRGETMTVAILDGNYLHDNDEKRLNWEFNKSILKKAENIMSLAIKKLI